MYTLSTEKKLAVLSSLVEGNSLRSISRMTDVDRNTISSLLLRTGENCAALLDARMRGLSCRRVQCDELWTFVAKKARNVRDSDPEEFGDAWVFIALDADTKLIPAYRIGKQSSENTQEFMLDLYRRIGKHRIQLTTDAFIFYTRYLAPFAFCKNRYGPHEGGFPLPFDNLPQTSMDGPYQSEDKGLLVLPPDGWSAMFGCFQCDADLSIRTPLMMWTMESFRSSLKADTITTEFVFV